MTKLDKEGVAALAAAARAFERAKKKGYVWIDDQTQMFLTYEADDLFMPPAPPNPDQLRF